MDPLALSLTQQYGLAVGVAGGVAGLTLWGWNLASPFRRDPLFRDRTPAGAAAPLDVTAAAAARAGTPQSHQRRRRQPVTPPSPNDALGRERAAALLARVRQLAHADARTAPHLHGAQLSWLVTGLAPATGYRAAFPDDHGYALLAGHVLAAGWESGVPDEVLLPIVVKMAEHRAMVVAEPTPPGPGPGPGPARSMYDRVGGPAVRTLVDQFYSALCGDRVTEPYFRQVDMARLRRHQAMMISQVLGGPTHYTDEQIGRAHAHITSDTGRPLVIDDWVFARTAAHALGVAWSLGLPEDITLHVVTALVSKRPLITDESRRGAERPAEPGPNAGGLRRGGR